MSCGNVAEAGEEGIMVAPKGIEGLGAAVISAEIAERLLGDASLAGIYFSADTLVEELWLCWEG